MFALVRPVSGAKGSFDGFGRVAGLIGYGSHRVFLLERKPRRQRAEPVPCSLERRPAFGGRRFRRDAGKPASAPDDAALRCLEKLAPGRDAMLLDELIRILGGSELA